MLLSNINAKQQSVFTKRTNGFTESEKETFKVGRNGLSQVLPNATPLPFQYRDTRQLQYNIDLNQALNSAQLVIDTKQKGGKIVTFDLETTGGFRALDFKNNITQNELNLRSITEFAVHTQYVAEGGVRQGEPIRQMFAFGIDASQESDYQLFFSRVRNQPLNALSGADRSTLERLSRYANAETFKMVNGKYELVKLGDSNLDIMSAYEGYQNLLKVGRNQGLGTELGRGMYQQALNILQGANVVSGYNILNFDLPVLDEMSEMFGLKKVNLSNDKVYDVMTSLRASLQGKGFSELHRIASHFGIENYNPSRPGSLEALADAIGYKIQAHYAASDVDATKDLGIFKKVFGDNFDLDLPTFTTQKVSQLLTSPNALTLTHENMKDKVIQANRALYSDARGFDYMKINGERQDNMSWSLNRGEYYKTDGVKFISKDELAKQVGLEEAQKILDYYKNEQGVYSMSFYGASKHNANREAQIFRGAQDDFQELFARNLIISNKVKSNRAVMGAYDVTQAAIDRATEQAMEDRARRDIVSALRNNGEFSATQLERMYNAYGQIETELQQKGIKLSKENFKKAINGQLEGVDVSKILKDNKITMLQQEKMGLAYGFFKNSHEFMTDTFDQINELITPIGIKRVIGDSGNVVETIDKAKQLALTKFLEPFEFGSVRMDMTESNAFTITIPQFDKNGDLIDGVSHLNVLKVTDGTSQLNNVISNIGKNQGQSVARLQQNKALNQVVQNLEGRGLLPTGAIVVNDAATPYNVVQSIAANLNAQIQTLMNTEELGLKQAIMSNKPINMINVMNSLDYGDHNLTGENLSFAYGYLADKASGMDGFSLNTAKVRYKDPKNKTQEAAMGIGSYFKRNRINKSEMVHEAVKTAYENIGFTANNSKDFDHVANILKERHGYSDSNVDTIRQMLFNEGRIDPKTGELKSAGMVKGYDMNVRFFERDGKLFLGATDQAKGKRFENAIVNGRSIDDLKQIGLVVGLPTVDDSLGTRTIKSGTIHKGITKQLNVYVPKGATGDVSTQLGIRAKDTVDDVLKFWIVGQQTAMRKKNAGDLEKANQILNSLVTKAIGNAPSLTANQAIRIKTNDGKIVYKHGVIPNVNDYELENLIQYGKLYNFIPMLYDKDEEIRSYINQRYFEQEGLTESQSAARIEKWKQNMSKGSRYMQDAGESGGETYIKETFMKSLRMGDMNILEKIAYYGAGTMDEESLNIVKSLAAGSKAGQIQTESKTKAAYLSQTNVLERNMYGFLSDIGRPNQNAGFNTIQYNPEVFTDEELKYLKSHGVVLGKQFTTDVDFKKGRMDNFESHITGTLKTMHSHEAIKAVQRTRSQSADLLAKYGNKFTQEDLNKVLDAFEFNANTYEQRLILNPLLRDTVWADPELIGVKTDGLTEAQLDELVQSERHLKTGDTIGTYQSGSLEKQLTYDKQVAGRIVSREGNTLYLLPDQQQVGARKLSIGGLEKGMAVAVDFGEEENKRLRPLIYDIWQKTYGNAAVVGNPEMGKHMAGGLTIGRYTNTMAKSVMGNERMEEKFLSVMNQYLPEWNAQFVDGKNGVRTFLISGDPNREAGNVKGLSQVQEAIAELAKEDKDFAKMNNALEKMFKNEEYLTTIARTTNSDQHPANAVKVQRRGRQILGTAGTDGYGTFEKGRLKRYGRVLADFEDELLSQTDSYKEGKRMAESVRTALKGMVNGDSVELSEKILNVNFEDFAIPASGLMAEDMNETFFGVIGRKYQDKFGKSEALKINLGNVSVLNPMTDKRENFIYLPKVMTQAVDGKVYFNKSNKGMADLLTAIEVLKGGTSELSYEGALEKVDDAYAGMLSQFFDEFTEKDGFFNSMVLEGRITHSARGLGSNIYAPVLEGMITGEVDGVKVTAQQVAEGAINEIKNGGERRYFKFHDAYTYRNAAKEQADGSLKLYDVVNTSRKQLERMGVDFTTLGEQAMDSKNFASLDEMNQFMDLVKAKGLTEAFIDESLEVSKEEIDVALEGILNRKREKYKGNVSITANDKEKAIEIATQARSKRVAEMKSKVGELYAKEIGIFGTNARDPLFLTTSKNVVKVHLDERITDDSWHIFSWLGKKLNQDTDGDATSVTLLLKNGRLLGEDHKVTKAARALHEAQAKDNLSKYISESFDGYLLDNKKTGRVDVVDGQLGDDIKNYIVALEDIQTAKNEAGELLDNNFKNEEAMFRGIKNRQNKDAIGYLSIPNYGIREASEAVFGVEGKTHMLESLYHFTDISEQKILDTKHVRNGGKEVTNVTMYRTGVRDLFSEEAMSDAKLQSDSLQQIINSFKGPIFKTDGLDVKASDLIGTGDLSKIYNMATQEEVMAMESIRSLHRLSQNQEALDIMNNPFFKSKAWWSNEKKIEALKQAVNGDFAKTNSYELNTKLDMLKGEPVIGISSEGLLLNSNGRYGTDAYRYKGAGVTKQGMYYGTLESIGSGESIKVYGETEEQVRKLIERNFVKTVSSDVDTITQELTDGFGRHFIEASTQSYQSFVQHKIEAEVVNEMLYNNGKASIIDLEDMIRQKVSLNSAGEASESMVESIFHRVRGYSQLEREAIAGLHESYFNTVAGMETEKFARTVEMMAGKRQVKSSDLSQMIRQFNEDIRERGRTPHDSRANIIRNHTPSNLNFTNAMLNAIEQESQGLKAFGSKAGRVLDLDALRQRYARYDLEASRASIKADLSAYQETLGGETFDKVLEPSFERLRIENNGLQADLEKQLSTLVNRGDSELLDWVNADDVSKAIPNMSQPQLDHAIRSIEESVITHGDFAGARIGELSLEDLRKTLSIDESKIAKSQQSALQGSKRQIETYFAALDHSSNNSVLQSIEDRVSSVASRTIGQEQLEMTIRDINDGIRNMAKQSKRQVSDGGNVASGTVEKIFNKTSGRIALGVGAAVVAASAVSGMQFSASQDSLKADQDNPYITGAKTASRSNGTPQPRYAPASQPTTYLNQDHQYKISARNGGRGNTSQASQMAARMTGSNQVRVVNSDNRNEISQQWLEQQVIELI